MAGRRKKSGPAVGKTTGTKIRDTSGNLGVFRDHPLEDLYVMDQRIGGR